MMTIVPSTTAIAPQAQRTSYVDYGIADGGFAGSTEICKKDYKSHNSSDRNSTNSATANRHSRSSTPALTWDASSMSSLSRRSSSTSVSTLMTSPSLQMSFASQQHPLQQQQKIAQTVSAVDQLYPTKKLAYDRIEYLEEQLKQNRVYNAQIIKTMSGAIEQFLHGRQNRYGHAVDIVEIDDCKDPIVGLEEMPRSLATALQQCPSQSEVNNNDEFCDSGNQDSVTRYEGTDQAWQENVSVIQEKHQRLICAIHALNRKKNRQISQLKAELKLQSKQQQQEKLELEQLLADMTQEMERMMEELSQAKQHCLEYEEVIEQKRSVGLQNGSNSTVPPPLPPRHSHSLHSKQHEQQEQQQNKQIYTDKDLQELKARITLIHSQEINALILEKEELRKRLIQSEKRLSEQQQQQQHNIITSNNQTTSPSEMISTVPSELERALQRRVAERDGEIAKLKHDMSKLKRSSEQRLQEHETRLQREVSIRVADFESRLKMQYQKEMDTYQVQLSREIRNLSGRIVELEAELSIEEGDEEEGQQQPQTATNINRSETDRISLQQQPHCPEQSSDESLRATLMLKEEEWMVKEDDLRQKLASAEQRIRSLEKETFVLYSKNLEMVKQLGELE